MTDATQNPMTRMHGTAVAVGETGVLFIGPSGAGKSSTALQLLALGAQLVADDQVELVAQRGSVVMRKPASLPGLIEARGVGLLHVRMADPTRLGLVVDMGRVAASRCPDPQTAEILGINFPKLDKVDASHFPAAILLYVKQLYETE